MGEVDFYRKQAMKISRMKPIRIETDPQYLGRFNYAIGYKVREQGKDFQFCVEFRRTNKPGFKKMFFTMEQAAKIMLLKNEWIENSLLNKQGLAAKIWNDANSSILRRRLEQKASRGTLKEEEVSRIMEEVEQFYQQVKGSMKA